MKCEPGVLMACSVFLSPGSIYDFYFLKQGSGHWYTWTEYITKEEESIPANAKVKSGTGRGTLASRMTQILRVKALTAVLCQHLKELPSGKGQTCVVEPGVMDSGARDPGFLTPPLPFT